MTNQQHPTTPPPELVQQWWEDTHGAFYEFEAITALAAQWGADQELEACCEWADRTGWQGAGDSLLAARRPKSPSLKEQALIEFDLLLGDSKDAGAAVILRALEQLPDHTSDSD